MEEAEDRRVTLRLPPDLHRKVADYAEAEGIPVNWAIIETLGEAFGYFPVPRSRQLG